MIPPELILIVFCMIGAAFFSGMETGVISIHKVKLRHMVEEGSRSAKILQGFVDRSDRLLGTTLVGTNICIVMVSVLSASVASKMLPTWGKAASSAIMTVLLLLFCEYMPKAWFQSNPLERCGLFASVLNAASIILRPISLVVIGLTGWLIPKSAAGLEVHRPFVTREDLKLLTKELGQQGVISPKERVMIHRVFEMSSRTVSEIMIPRDEMTFVPANATLDEIVQTSRDTGFTRLPVFDEGADEFVGITNARYLLSLAQADQNQTAAVFSRPASRISASMPVDDILARMKRLRQPMCLVAGSDGEVLGLITREDVLEEIVGTL